MNPETVTSTVENDEVESLKRKAKRAANSHRDRVRRGRYFGSEKEQLRCSRLEKQRERSEQNRATKTEEEKKLLQEEKIERSERGDIMRLPIKSFGDC